MIHRGYLLCLATAVILTPTLAQGQTPPRPPGTSKSTVLTIFTAPENANVTISGIGRGGVLEGGDANLIGRTPLDVPPLMTGTYSVVVEGPGLARTQGMIYLPPPGELPFIVSEPPGISAALLLRGINYPGVPNIAAGRAPRGVPLLTCALGAGFMAVRAHLYYRDRLDEPGDFAADRAQEEKAQRNSWIVYSASLWGMSALDYWIRPRLSLNETTPNRLTLGVPRTTRGSVIWRSILLPGAGQEFGGHRTRSVVWLSTVILSGGGYVVADYRYDRDVTDLKWAQIGVDTATPSELPQRQAQLAQAQRSLDASKDIRRAAVIGIVAFHALNIFDTMVMRLKLEPPDKPKVSSIAPIMLPDGPGVGVTLLF